MSKLNWVQKKILYLNIMFLFVFICGLTLAIIGFTPLGEGHMLIVESFGIPMVSFSIASWGIECNSYIGMRKEQEKGKGGE